MALAIFERSCKHHRGCAWHCCDLGRPHQWATCWLPRLFRAYDQVAPASMRWMWRTKWCLSDLVVMDPSRRNRQMNSSTQLNFAGGDCWSLWYNLLATGENCAATLRLCRSVASFLQNSGREIWDMRCVARVSLHRTCDQWSRERPQVGV